MTLMTRPDVDYADVQGLVRFGYKKMTEAVYLLARVKNADAARAWLRSAPVSNAVMASPAPTTALQVAFTAPGLAALGIPASVLGGFSAEFLGGMTQESRLRRSGDVGTNAPSQWDWGWHAAGDGEAVGGAAGVPDVAVMFFAETGAEHGGGLEAFIRRVTGGSWNDAFEVLRRLETSDLGGIEPFGFADGISQPVLDWPGDRDPTSAQIHYGNVVALGEVLLGYANEYGKYTERPLLADGPATATLLPAADAPALRDLARNGTYLVLRQLRQDVRAFWQFISAHAGRVNGPHSALAEKLSAAFVGRTTAGDPLVPTQLHEIPGIGATPDEVRLNQFTFDDDPRGARCPLGAHIRRANPRNADYPGRPTGLARLVASLGLRRRGFRDDLTSSVRFHRIVRRGREYGPRLTPDEALLPAPPDDPERGLHFICLNANISRQFEFLQNAWVMNTKFFGLTGTSDPLLGNREPIPGCPATSDFPLGASDAPSRRVTGLPQFVTVRGGAYFFLPSLRALRFFAVER